MEELQQHTEPGQPQVRSGVPRARKVSPGAPRTSAHEVPATTDTAPPKVAEATLHQSAATTTDVSHPTSATSHGPAPSRPTPSQEAANTAEPKRRLRHEEKYDRITLYLEKRVHNELRELYDSGEVENLSALFNAAVKDYLAKHFCI